MTVDLSLLSIFNEVPELEDVFPQAASPSLFLEEELFLVETSDVAEQVRDVTHIPWIDARTFSRPPSADSGRGVSSAASTPPRPSRYSLSGANSAQSLGPLFPRTISEFHVQGHCLRRSASSASLNAPLASNHSSRPPSRGSMSISPERSPSTSPTRFLRRLSSESRSFGEASPFTDAAPIRLGGRVYVSSEQFFTEECMFTRCFSGQVPPRAIKNLSQGKDGFVTTTDDYKANRVPIDLPSASSRRFTTINDASAIAAPLALTRDLITSISVHGAWFLTIGTGHKAAIPKNRLSADNIHFQDVPSDAQCGRIKDSNFREYVVANSECFEHDVRRGHIHMYKIESDGRTEEWTFREGATTPTPIVPVRV